MNDDRRRIDIFPKMPFMKMPPAIVDDCDPGAIEELRLPVGQCRTAEWQLGRQRRPASFARPRAIP